MDGSVAGRSLSGDAEAESLRSSTCPRSSECSGGSESC